MNDKWRLLDTGSLSAAENMALNQVILECRNKGLSPDTMRFLQFTPHCALVGYHQSVELEVEEDYCREHGLDINRRITGGGNLYFDESQLGWEIYTGRDKPGIPQRLEDLYRHICECGVAGLKKLGITSNFRPKNDIEVCGRKISGTGGKDLGNAFLYQGTLLTNFDVDTMLACLKLPLKKLDDKAADSFRQRVACLKEILGSNMPTMDVIKNAVVQGFEEVLEIELVPGELTPEEQTRFTKLLPYFQSEKWIYGDRRIQDNQLKVVDYKCAGGLIRVYTRIDPERQLIKTVFITGDFFAYPDRTVLDLEVALKNSSAREEDIRKNVQTFFSSHNVHIPNMEAKDFSCAIIAAVKKEGDVNKG